MNVILLTILLTLLGSWLIVLLVWLSVTTYKSMKIKKSILSRLDNLEESLSTSNNNMYNHIDETVVIINRNLEELNTQLSNDVNQLNTTIVNDVNGLYKTIRDNKTEGHNNLSNAKKELYESIKSNSDSAFHHIDENYKNLTNNLNSLSDKILDMNTEPSFIFDTKKKKKK
jgi:predicted phage-related endonuclease